MILAIDLGVHMGWVLADAIGPMRFGTIELKDTTNLGQYIRSMNAPLQQLIPLARAIAVEKPNTAGESAYYAIRKNMAALGKLCELCDFMGKPQPTEISVMTGKLTLAGSGRAEKPQMIAAAHEQFGVDMNEHEADALGIWKTFVFGAAVPIRKARSKSSPGKVITP